MTEPDVALTDFALALLCGWFVLNLTRQTRSSHRDLWIVFFASVSLASLTGGLVHGFFLDETTWAYRILWPATLLAIGLTAASGWVLAGFALHGEKRLTSWIMFAAILFAVYAGNVVFISQEFVIAILNYVPAIIAFLVASLLAYFRGHVRGYLWISTGIVLTFVAAIIQQAKIAIHPLYFNHNAFYHVVQAIALGVLFVGAKRLLAENRVSS